MTLYNAATTSDGVRFAKWDDNMDLEKVYTVTKGGASCDCPAGRRPTCRHRQMYWTFSQLNRLNSEWFYDFDTKAWSKPLPSVLDTADYDSTPPSEPVPQVIQAQYPRSSDDKPWRRPI